MAQRVTALWAKLGVGVGLCALLLSVTGCPCEGEDRQVQLVAASDDPSLGRFQGTLSWLQTGEQTQITVDVTRPATTAASSGCARLAVDVDYATQSTDGVVSAQQRQSLPVDDNGVIVEREVSLIVDANSIIEAGKVPDAPQISTRQPVAFFTLEPPAQGGTWTLTLHVTSSADRLTVASAELTAQ